MLIRTKRGVKLTESGKILASQAQLLRQSWSDIRDNVIKSRTEVVGRLTIGCHSEVAIDSLPLFLPSLLEEYPNLEIKLVHELSRKILDDVVGFEIDIGIVVNPLRHRDLVIKKLSSDEVTLWVGKGKRKTQDIRSEDAVLICDPDLLQSGNLIKALGAKKLDFNRFIHSRDLEVIASLVAAGTGTTIIAVDKAAPIISHLPLQLDSTKYEKGALFGHMAFANPLWRSFSNEREITAIFHGPHAYISARWYLPQPDNVPTWNYAVVHVHGIAQVIKDEKIAYQTMRDLTHQHDPEWTLALSDKDRRELMSQIVVFEISISRIEAKFKLSQNREEADRSTIIKSLSTSASYLDRETAALMQKMF